MPCPPRIPGKHLADRARPVPTCEWSRSLTLYRTGHALSLRANSCPFYLIRILMQMPERKSPRAEWLTYNEGDFFVTVCTKDKIHFFGEIVDGRMTFTEVGEYLDRELHDFFMHHHEIEVLLYTVMPNHFHAIVRINGYSMCADRARPVPTSGQSQSRRNTVLTTYIGSLKSAVSKFAHSKGVLFAWQSRFHDHVIRGTDDGNRIAQYIINNVAKWDADCFYSM